MKLRFVKYNPSENMTVLVLDPVERERRKDIAKAIMDYSSINCEQVGFLMEAESPYGRERGLMRLEMMGGEFCGNASRCLASYLIDIGHPSVNFDGNAYRVEIESSGYDGPVKFKIEDKSHFIRNVEVEMPLPLEISRMKVQSEDREVLYREIDMPGISHMVVHHKLRDPSSIKKEANRLFPSVKDHFSQKEAFGIMFFNDDNNYLTPLVYVKETDSVIWERSCATGSTAVGISQSLDKRSSISTKIGQPGGSLLVKTDYDQGEIKEVALSGQVELVCEGFIYL